MTGGMMFKGTPGPWKIYRYSGNIESIGPCEAEEYAGTSWLEVSEEDANLIAAAPELLEVVMRLANGERSDEGHTAIRDAAIAAIAKALGEQK